MFQRVLIPTDGSECSLEAIARGLELVKPIAADIKFLHVLEQPLLPFADDLVYSPEFHADLRKAGELILRQASEMASAVGVSAGTLLIERRDPVSAILEAAREADLIVIGTHGRRGFDRFVFGSIAEGVLRRTSVPCLVIRCEQLADRGGRDYFDLAVEEPGAKTGIKILPPGGPRHS